MKKLITLVLIFFPLIAPAAPVKDKHVSAELISEVRSISPGRSFWVALKLVHDEHWHTYWINDGDSGMPTTIEWHLPLGFTAGPIVWPYPGRIVMAPLVSYGFEGTTYLLTEITPPAELSDTTISLGAKAKWLMCEEVCIPGKADVGVSVTVASEPVIDPSRAPEFSVARAHLPSVDPGWRFSARADEDHVVVTATPPAGTPPLTSLELFPVEKGVVAASLEKQWEQTDQGYVITMDREINEDPLPDLFRAVIVSAPSTNGSTGVTALDVIIPFMTSFSANGSAAGDSSSRSLAVIVLFAFLGGIILNLMPCVFPVISLKILGFVNQAKNDPKAVWHHGLVFSAGVIVSFWLLAGLLLIFRASGESIGWGFQLQSPHVVIALALLFFVLALNLFGMFEFGLSLTTAGGSLATMNGWSGSFFSGFLATVVATPCTAPFMGVALGYALTQPPYVSMIVFTSLALGMASPYLVISRFPVLLRVLPRPGAWMVTMKQGMGFILLATVLWLLWVLSALASANTLVFVLTGMLCASIAAWVLGKWSEPSRTTGTRWIGRIIAFVLASMTIGLSFNYVESGSTVTDGAANGWEPFSPERLAELRKEGKPVFIDFTAKWCLTCQVNKITALRKPAVVEAFGKKGVVLLEADWTDENEIIAKELAKFGRQSVPLYVLYPPGESGKPVLLPEILTQAIVLDALNKLN